VVSILRLEPLVAYANYVVHNLIDVLIYAVEFSSIVHLSWMTDEQVGGAKQKCRVGERSKKVGGQLDLLGRAAEGESSTYHFMGGSRKAASQPILISS
jgi:hypothetical protein